MKFGAFGRDIKIVTGKCSRCRKDFEASERVYIPGKSMCRECTILVRKVIQIERELLSKEFSIEKEDAEIARQVNEILIRESSGSSEEDEQLLNSLMERLLQDEKRRKKLLKDIRKLQKRK